MSGIRVDAQTGAICGKAMEPRNRQNYYIKSKVSKVSKDAQAAGPFVELPHWSVQCFRTTNVMNRLV
jgi:hypothetical protein